ncbi:NAD-dependent deacylase [Naumannella sp. ID2617S]|nr:NAD-dependent deacylase [Naumannella sp. ID2617S]
MVPSAIADLVTAARRITVLTGAGMSAESGVPTFRDAQTGWWARYDPMQLATPEAFDEDPDLVWAWYLRRLQLVRGAQPHSGHHALSSWAVLRPLSIVTQNVDDLHERAGSTVLAHLHGSLAEFRCASCGGTPQRLPELPDEVPERVAPPFCTDCGGRIRPGVVWFGEALPQQPFADAEQAVTDADLVLVVGTSGLVQPAAGLPLRARAAGVPTVELNPTDTALSDYVQHRWRTTAAEGLPRLLELLG